MSPILLTADNRRDLIYGAIKGQLSDELASTIADAVKSHIESAEAAARADERGEQVVEKRTRTTKEFVKERIVPHIKELIEGSVSLYTEFPKWLVREIQIRELHHLHEYFED